MRDQPLRRRHPAAGALSSVRCASVRALHPAHPCGCEASRCVGQVEISARRRAAAEHGGGDVEAVQIEIAIFDADPAAAHIAAEQRRAALMREFGAMRAGQRQIFDQLHPRIGIADAKAAFGRARATVGSSRARRRRRPRCAADDAAGSASIAAAARAAARSGPASSQPPICARSSGSSCCQLPTPSCLVSLMKKVGVPVTPCSSCRAG